MQERQPHDDLERFLVRAVLDAEFCALARRDPDAAFEGYALSDEDRQTLRAGDEGVLRLLGRVLRGAAPPEPREDPTPAPAADGTDTGDAPPAQPAQAVPLQPVSLVVTIQPFALSTPAGLQLSFGASIAPAPQAAAADAPPHSGEAPAAPAGDAAPWSPWDHDRGSQSTRAAAAAVHAATADARRERILELLAAMTSRERIGGDGDAPDA